MRRYGPELKSSKVTTSASPWRFKVTTTGDVFLGGAALVVAGAGAAYAVEAKRDRRSRYTRPARFTGVACDYQASAWTYRPANCNGCKADSQNSRQPGWQGPTEGLLSPERERYRAGCNDWSNRPP